MRRLDGKRVYISGPITDDPQAALRFAQAFKACVDARALMAFNPLGPAEQAKRGGFAYQDHMRADLHMLTSETVDTETKEARPLFDVLLQLPGWNASPGAVLERRVADACGIERLELAELDGVDCPWSML